MDWNLELTRLEKKRDQLHSYLLMKLDERDYHAIADAAMDLRELDARSNSIKDWLSSK